MNTKQLIAPAFAYFALVFSAGFLLGTIRVLWLVPLLSVLTAELAEMPIMLMVVFLAARWSTKRFNVPPAAASRLVVGIAALICLLLVEFTVVVWLQGMSIAESLANRDPIAGAAYTANLIVFALMPALVNHSQKHLS